MSSMSTRKAIFILSLDLELLWGLINTKSYNSIHLLKRVGGLKLRDYIDFLKSVLEKYRVPATWAVVGRLLLDLRHEQGDLLHRCNSRFVNSNSFGISTESCNNTLYFGKDILEKILSSTVGHEIAYHSFSHVIFSQISKEEADLEIKAGIEIAKQFGISFRSFVFPQNEIGYTDVLRKYGFIVYRGETLRHSKHRALALHKVDGFVNEIIAPPVVPEWKNGIWEIPSSMEFCDPKYPFSLLPRAKLGLWRAVRSNMIFHVWMHPWDLLGHESLSRDFERFIKYVQEKRNEGKIKVMTMGDFAACLDKTHGMDTKARTPL